MMANLKKPPDPDRIAKLCLKKFNELPKSGKPVVGKEWTVLSCIIKLNEIDDEMEVVALGTGEMELFHSFHLIY